MFASKSYLAFLVGASSQGWGVIDCLLVRLASVLVVSLPRTNPFKSVNSFPDHGVWDHSLPVKFILAALISMFFIWGFALLRGNGSLCVCRVGGLVVTSPVTSLISCTSVPSRQIGLCYQSDTAAENCIFGLSVHKRQTTYMCSWVRDWLKIYIEHPHDKFCNLSLAKSPTTGGSPDIYIFYWKIGQFLSSSGPWKQIILLICYPSTPSEKLALWNTLYIVW